MCTWICRKPRNSKMKKNACTSSPILIVTLTVQFGFTALDEASLYTMENEDHISVTEAHISERETLTCDLTETQYYSRLQVNISTPRFRT
jgi:hypothetical protein